MVNADIICFRGDTYYQSFTGLDFENFSKIYFTVKQNYRDSDSQSIIQISSSSGLLYLSGCPSGSPVSGSIVYVSASQVLVILDAWATSQINYPKGNSNYYYDLQVLYNTGKITTLQLGEFIFSRDITRKIT